MNKIYIAAPWFTEEQEVILKNVKDHLISFGLPYFSPKDENLWRPGMTPLTVLLGNIMPLQQASLVVAVTDGKDVGTIWECGFAYANKVPILYIWLGRQPGQKFNIMLAASGETVFSYEELDEQLEYFKANRHLKRNYIIERDYE